MYERSQFKTGEGMGRGWWFKPDPDPNHKRTCHLAPSSLQTPVISNTSKTDLKHLTDVRSMKESLG